MAANEKTRGLSPHLCPKGPIKLDTLANVRAEMVRLYRLALKGDVEADMMTKFIYALKEIRGCIEAGLLEDVQRRMVDLSTKVGVHHRGH
jgi:hypothetical protein